MSTLECIIKEPNEAIKASVIWLHGLGASADDFLPIVPRLKLPQIRFIFPQAPVQPVTLNQGYAMPAWYDIYGLDLNSKQDEAGIRKTEQEISALIQREIEQGIPANKIVLMGFSQGGAVALHTALRFTERLGGVMALSSYLPLADFLMEEKHPTNQDLPIFVAHGTQDQVLPLLASELTCEYLEAQNYAVDYHVYDMAHEVCLPEIRDIAAWLQKVLE